MVTHACKGYRLPGRMHLHRTEGPLNPVGRRWCLIALADKVSFMPYPRGSPIPDPHERLRHIVEHAARLLPAQGPIGVFIHHNTLHAFQHMPFEEAVVAAAGVYGAEPYMSEEAYRREVGCGRIVCVTSALLASLPAW